jgi:hypothetical protein
MNISGLRETSKNCSFRDTHPFIFSWQVFDQNNMKVFGDGRLYTNIKARIYRTKSGIVRAIVYATYKGKHARGIGVAKGWGYEKKSAAVEHAFCDMGITDFKEFGGVGDGAVVEALVELAKELGMENPAVIESYP